MFFCHLTLQLPLPQLFRPSWQSTQSQVEQAVQPRGGAKLESNQDKGRNGTEAAARASWNLLEASRFQELFQKEIERP